MSWKGIQKGIARTPQTFKQRFNMGTTTKDPIYIDAERRFNAIEAQTKKLHEEAKRYWQAISGMLQHQYDFATAIEQVYKPISGVVSDPDSLIPEGNPEGIEACEQYRDLVSELQDSIKPELELIQTKVLSPADELLKIIKNIRKMMVKRDHKQLDLDRHQASLKKYQDKKERSVKEEEKLYKAENDVEIAAEEFRYYNDLLKDELPRLFQLEGTFIKPLFESLYYMQLNIFYTLFMRLEEMKIPYFTLTQDIVAQFEAKRGDIKEKTEEIGITHFKMGHTKKKLQATKKRFGKAAEADAEAAEASPGQLPAYSQQQVYQPVYDASGQPVYDANGQPVYTVVQVPQATATVGAGAVGAVPGAVPGAAAGVGAVPGAAPVAAAPAAAAATTAQGYPNEKQVYQPAAAAAAVPAAAPIAAAPGAFCTALYDYTAQADGDLTFRAGDRIQIVQKTDANGWWTGVLNGVQGVFPGNYVQE